MELKNLKINFDSMKDFDTVNIDDLKSETEYKIERLNVLKSVHNKDYNCNGLFADNIWAIENSLNHVYHYLNFSELEPLIFKGLSKAELLVIKCWIGGLIIDKPSISGSSLLRKLNYISIAINETNNFSCSEDDNIEDSMILQVAESIGFSDNTIAVFLYDILEYLDFLENLYLPNMDNRISKYQFEIKKLKKKYKAKSNPRKLPGSRDIILFSEYLEVFFKENNDLELKILYFPILIWWKLTNIIPMRISELCRNLTRECIIEENNTTYLKIVRVKNADEKERSGLPILDKIAISEEIASLIREYIQLTDNMGSSNTLFSYKAMLYCKDKLHLRNYDYRYLTQTKKNNQNYFSAPVFSTLLDGFYEDIIKRKLKDDTIETKINPNDTRHFAFFSLLMQGIDPVEIALLGGHSNLKTQENYQHEISYYVDSELYKLINKRMASSKNIDSKSSKNLKAIFKNMSKEPPKPFLQCRALDIGYCTCDFSKEESCEDLDECSNCSKWWVYPSSENFNKKLQELKDKKLKQHKQEIQKSSVFLSQILSEAKTNNIRNEFFLDDKSSKKLQTVINQIKSECQAINEIRDNFIDYDILNNDKLDIAKNLNILS